MDIPRFLLYVLVMAGVTSLICMLPLTILRKKIESKFIKSFLFYVPYAVLGAMTFPAILSSTGSLWSALAGFAVAIVLAIREKGLLTVAMSACGTVFLVELAMRMWIA